MRRILLVLTLSFALSAHAAKDYLLPGEREALAELRAAAVARIEAADNLSLEDRIAAAQARAREERITGVIADIQRERDYTAAPAAAPAERGSALETLVRSLTEGVGLAVVAFGVAAWRRRRSALKRVADER